MLTAWDATGRKLRISGFLVKHQQHKPKLNYRSTPWTIFLTTPTSSILTHIRPNNSEISEPHDKVTKSPLL